MPAAQEALLLGPYMRRTGRRAHTSLPALPEYTLSNAGLYPALPMRARPLTSSSGPSAADSAAGSAPPAPSSSAPGMLGTLLSALKVLV